MFTWFRVKRTAQRLGLRDKGFEKRAVPWGKDWKPPPIHPFCYTRVRIGIVKDNGEAVHWCYRCEKVLPPEEDDDNRGGGSERKIAQPSPTLEDIELFLESKELTKQAMKKMKLPR